MISYNLGILAGHLMGDLEKKIEEQERKILTNLEEKIEKQKNENEALLEEVDMKIDKNKNETAHMLGIIFSNITRAVNSGVASTGIKSYLTHVCLLKFLSCT